MSGYCPTDPCAPCVKAQPMNLCFATLQVTGLNANASVALRFQSQADGQVFMVSETSDANGVVTIQQADAPTFISGVTYRLTALGYDLCYLITFEHRAANGAWVTGTNEVVEEC